MPIIMRMMAAIENVFRPALMADRFELAHEKGSIFYVQCDHPVLTRADGASASM